MSTTLNPTSTPVAPTAAPAGIDPRGPQFAASLTAVVLVAVLLLPPAAALALTAVQAALFALGAARGVQRTPHAWLFKTFVRPRLAAPTELEAPEPPRFAQAVGLGFTVVALIGYAAGAVGLAQAGACTRPAAASSVIATEMSSSYHGLFSAGIP